MIKSSSRTSRLPRILAFVAAAVLLALAILFALEKFNITNITNVSSGSSSQDSNGGNTGPTEEEAAMQAQLEADQKQNYLDSLNSADNNPASSSGSQTNTDSATLNISANQDSNTITVLTQIQGIAEGTCRLSASNDSKTTVQSAQIIYQPEFSSCAGFSVDSSALGAGAWIISVTVTPTNGPTITQSTSLEVK